MKSWFGNLELDELCSIQNKTSVVTGAGPLKPTENTKEKSKQCFTYRISPRVVGYEGNH